MAILDELAGVLDAESIAKIKANSALTTKLTKGDELYGYYADEEPVAPPVAAAPPAAVAPPSGAPPSLASDLGAIERMLDKRFTNLDATLGTKIDEAIKSKATEFINAAVKTSVQRSDELNRVYTRHHAETGQVFDSTKFNEYLEANKDKGYRTITEAYEAWTAPEREERRVDAKVAEKLKTQSGAHVPGTTPGPAVAHTGNVLKIMQRGKPGEGAGTGAQRAAEKLQRLEASRAEAAS